MAAPPTALEAPDAARRLAALGAVTRSDWPPGPSFAAHRGRALVRVGEPEPGEGYHREHVRLLHGAGEASALSELLGSVLESLDPGLRLEAEAVRELEPDWAEALEAAGLPSEGRLPAAWRPEGGPAMDLILHGRAPARRRRAPAAPRAPARPEPPSLPPGLRAAVHGPATRAALRRFLDGLVPGRSYPPGTLLSESERSETRRRGDLEAEWVLALASDGSVVGAVVLEPGGRLERGHVRRLHVDVSSSFRGAGIATLLLRAARRRAAELGALRVEADPRAGHAAVRAALRAAGLRACATREAAWRMRTPTASWDEDLVLMAAEAG